MEKRLLGFFYGGIIASSYLIIKIVTENSYLLYFTTASGVLALVTMPFLKGSIPRPLKGVLLRGFLYAVTNFMILTSQNKGMVSSSVTAALIGSMCVSLPGLIMPPHRKKNFIILGCIFIGTILLLEEIVLSYLALVSGVIQAITFVSASRVMRIHQISISWNLFIGFVIATIIGVILSLIMPDPFSGNVKIIKLLCICFVILISQISFFQLYKNFSTEVAGRYSLGRVPWSFLIDMIYFGKIFNPLILAGATFLSLGAFMRRERRVVRR